MPRLLVFFTNVINSDEKIYPVCSVDMFHHFCWLIFSPMQSDGIPFYVFEADFPST
jgi:hypothetical protein